MVPAPIWDGLSAKLNVILPEGRGVVRAGDKAHKLGTRLDHVKTLEEFNLSLMSEWQSPTKLIRGVGKSFHEPSSLLDDPVPSDGVGDCRLHMMYQDSVAYLPDDILCKVDRAAMAASLETRVPLLDHRVVELAWRLPLEMKIRDGRGKWVLREVLNKYVPKEFIDRPKSGFRNSHRTMASWRPARLG